MRCSTPCLSSPTEDFLASTAPTVYEGACAIPTQTMSSERRAIHSVILEALGVRSLWRRTA